MFNLGTGELLIIFLVILLLFGAKRLPELARGLGKGINEFKDAVETGKKEILDAEKETKISFLPVSTASLNSFMPLPRPLASSGSLLAPKRSKITRKIISSSPVPKLNMS
jgi:TatA/E family protein of Tat protein translocase